MPLQGNRSVVVGILLQSSPPNTTPPNTASPPNTAAHFQVPNKGFVGYKWVRIPPISEYRRFFVSPEIGGIERGDCKPLWTLMWGYINPFILYRTKYF